MLYDRRVPLHPEWEHVVPGMFDALTAHPRIDSERVALVGRSFGGLLAPRGAAGGNHGSRLTALIVDPGQWDVGAAMRARLGPLADLIEDPEAGNISTGQGKLLFDQLSGTRQFRLLTVAEGAEGHCEGMAPVVFWDAAFDWLDSLLAW